jgi:SAM-dependent methyltransferase
MFRYQATALALKLFSATGQTRSAYRRMGNWRRNRSAASVHRDYLDNARWLLDVLRREGFLGGDPMRALEIGTGWLHYYGTSLALSSGCEVDLYDVWDNRQFDRFAATFRDPAAIIDDLELNSEAARRRAHMISKAEYFDDVYRALGMRYVVDPEGELGQLPSGRYDVAFSVDVLEHVHSKSLARSISAMHRVLRPGGLAVHQIGVDDHLTHYDRRASLKQYLSYGPMEWKVRFANAVQYTNLASFDEFRALFAAAGFEELEASVERRPDQLEGVRIAKRFRSQTPESLEAVRLFLVYRKPRVQ